MKKTILIIIAVFIIIGIAGIVITINKIPIKLELENDAISYIVVRNGTTGEGITLETEKEIAELVTQFNELRLVKSKKLGLFVGYTIALTVYNKSDINKFDSYVVSIDGIIHKNYLYSNGDEINLQERLLNMFD